MILTDPMLSKSIWTQNVYAVQGYVATRMNKWDFFQYAIPLSLQLFMEPYGTEIDHSGEK